MVFRDTIVLPGTCDHGSIPALSSLFLLLAIPIPFGVFDICYDNGGYACICGNGCDEDTGNASGSSLDLCLL